MKKFKELNTRRLIVIYMWSSDKFFSLWHHHRAPPPSSLSLSCVHDSLDLFFLCVNLCERWKEEEFLCDEETKWGGKWTEEVINNFMPVTCDNFSRSLHITRTILKNVFWNVLNVFLISQLFVDFKERFNFLFGAGEFKWNLIKSL